MISILLRAYVDGAIDGTLLAQKLTELLTNPDDVDQAVLKIEIIELLGD